jgi:hypothetical protein
MRAGRHCAAAIHGRRAIAREPGGRRRDREERLPSISTTAATGARSRSQTCAARMFGASFASSSGVRSRQGTLRCPACWNESFTTAFAPGLPGRGRPRRATAQPDSDMSSFGDKRGPAHLKLFRRTAPLRSHGRLYGCGIFGNLIRIKRIKARVRAPATLAALDMHQGVARGRVPTMRE